MNKEIQWYVFQLQIFTKIDWKTKKFEIRKYIEKLMVNFKTLFELNKKDTYCLKNLCNKTFVNIIKKEYPVLKNIPFITFQISIAEENNSIKQGILFINNNDKINKIIEDNKHNQNTKTKFNYSKFLFVNLYVNSSINNYNNNNNYKINLFKNMLNSKINNRYFNEDKIILDDLTLKLNELLECIYPYFYILKFTKKENIKNLFLKK